jgi:hypothetical protein
MIITGSIYEETRPIHWGPDANGDIMPLASGLVYFYEAGTSTPLDIYSDADLTTPLDNPLELDANGRASTVVYMAATSYKVVVKTAAEVTVYTADNVSNIAQVILGQLGIQLADGARAVASGYTVTETSNLITVASTGGPNPCVINLPPASERLWPLTIKNMGTVALAVTPDGADTIEDVAAAYTVPAAASPAFPTITLVPDGSDNWLITSSHKCP